MIIKKVTLLDAAVPFVGTRIAIAPTAESPTWGFYSASFAEGSTSFSIDWGDGTSETVTSAASLPTHTYVPGIYEVRISDDIKALALGHSGIWSDAYAPLVTRFETTAKKLEVFPVNAFWRCLQMTSLVFSGGVDLSLKVGVFKECSALTGRIDLTHVRSFVSTNVVQMFQGCNGGITEIHFDRDMEDYVKANAGYQSDPTLGSGTGVCIFDL